LIRNDPPPVFGSKPAKGVDENPRSAAERDRGKDPIVRPGRGGSEPVAEHRPKAKRRCMTVPIRRICEAEALDVTGRSWAWRDSDSPSGPRRNDRRSAENAMHVQFSRRVYATRILTWQKQPAHPLIELHRIVFVKRTTAWATSTLECPRTRGSSNEEQTPKRDRAEHGSSVQRVAGQWALKGTKPQERRPINTAHSACDSATDIKRRSRGAEGEIGPTMPGSSWAVDGQATCRLVRQARTRRWRGRRGAGCSLKRTCPSMTSPVTHEGEKSPATAREQDHRPKPIGPVVPG